MLHDSGRTRL